ncbi:MAG TPA: chromosomal replication initiator protein DnaA [Candidatus Bathyarchaeia archaeon]|nr:chromosomal replication initiator protein DnaA [Candidatus Bathyarchaeia archaeon]
MSTSNIWNTIESALKERIGTTSFETWFSAISIKETDSSLILETPDEFFKNWILEHYQKTIEELISRVTSAVSVSITVNPCLMPDEKKEGGSPVEIFTKQADNKTSLNSRFSFDSFVVGPSNRFAFAACQAVAESPAKSYNPLFLYSHVGLGKTHLMQAIAHEIKTRHPKLSCLYLSSEMFTNELINAIRHRSTSEFRERYRTIDVLLIDDIHFIAGKESTQEEFFHTFNALHNNHKQIIISSDRPPKEITNLEERLSSRFAWGLIADIQPPDFETRAAILRKKLEREPVEVPDEVISFIAEQIRTNIRELEGALIRVVAYSLLEERPVSLEIAKIVLKDMVQETSRTVNINTIQKEVADFFHIQVGDLKSKKRSRNVIIPRQVCMYLVRKLTNLSFPEIGLSFGGKDHTTVLHSCKKMENELLTNEEIKKQIAFLLTRITQ